MQNPTVRTPLSVMLARRLGRGFSEADTREILRQVLPQLAILHNQGQAHGAISLDTLVQRGNQVVIAPPSASLPATQVSISQDIYELGVAMIELLTAKAPSSLQNSDGNWNWEENCILSARLAAVINRMIAKQPQNRFTSANEVLSALSFTVHQPLDPPPTPSSSQPASVLSDTQPIHSRSRKSKLATWQRFLLLAILAFVVILASVWAWSLFFPKPILINAINAPSGTRTKSWEKAQLLGTISGHSKAVNSVAISADGELIVSGSSDETIKIWNLATREVLRTLSSDSEVYSIAISPDGQTLVSGGSEQTIIWNLTTGERRYSLDFSDTVSVAISPDNQTFANNDQIWNLRTGQFICTLSEERECDRSVIPKVLVIDSTGDVFDSSGNKFAIQQCWGIASGYMRLVGANGEVRNQAGKILTNPSPQGYHRCVEYNRTIYLVNTVQKWSYSSESGVRFVKSYIGDEDSDSLSDVAISLDGEILASDGDKTIKIWNLRNRKITRTISDSKPINALAISPDGQMIASGYGDTTIKIWNSRTGELLGTLGSGVIGTLARVVSSSSNYVTCIAFNPDGQTIASASADNTIKIWNLRTSKVIRTLEGHSEDVNAVAFSSNGSTLVSGSDDGTIKVWR